MPDDEAEELRQRQLKALADKKMRRHQADEERQVDGSLHEKIKSHKKKVEKESMMRKRKVKLSFM
jgi:hypothetical protein